MAEKNTLEAPITAAGPEDHGGELHAGTEAKGGHGEAHPTMLGLGAEEWVFVSVTIFILLAIFVAKAPRKITDALDAKIADVRRELDEARALRAEAEALLADARRQEAEAGATAAAMLSHARTEADQLLAQAQADAEALVLRRRRMAEDKIGAAERGAVAEVRAAAARAAAEAATQVLASSIDAGSDKALIDQAIGDLDKRLH